MRHPRPLNDGTEQGYGSGFAPTSSIVETNASASLLWLFYYINYAAHVVRTEGLEPSISTLKGWRLSQFAYALTRGGSCRQPPTRPFDYERDNIPLDQCGLLAFEDGINASSFLSYPLQSATGLPGG